jgi:hypothetical protein
MPAVNLFSEGLIMPIHVKLSDIIDGMESQSDESSSYLKKTGLKDDFYSSIYSCSTEKKLLSLPAVKSYNFI